MIDDGSGPRALPAVAITPDGGVYDYTARYTAGATEFVVPAELDDRAGRGGAPASPWRPTRCWGCATCPART